MPCRGMRVDESSVRRCEASERWERLAHLIGNQRHLSTFGARRSKSEVASLSLGKDDFSFCKGHVHILPPFHTNLYTPFT